MMTTDTYISSGFSVFQPPGLSFSVTDSSLTKYFPLAPLDVKNPIEFFVPSSVSDPFMDLNTSYLYTTFHVTLYDKKRGGARGLEEPDNVSIANNFLQSMFSSVDVYLQETLLDSSCNNNNAYRSYFHNLLNYSQQDKSTTLAEEGFYKDTQGKFDNVSGDNDGGKKRKALMINNNKVHTFPSLLKD